VNDQRVVGRSVRVTLEVRQKVQVKQFSRKIGIFGKADHSLLVTVTNEGDGGFCRDRLAGKLVGYEGGKSAISRGSHGKALSISPMIDKVLDRFGIRRSVALHMSRCASAIHFELSMIPRWPPSGRLMTMHNMARAASISNPTGDIRYE
jgi:hypothetical protein